MSDLVDCDLVDYFVRHYTLVMDNDQGPYFECIRATHEAILAESPDLTLAEYLAMNDSQRETAYAAEIGAGILGLIEEWTDEVMDASGDGIGAQLIRAVLITNGVAYELGKHYMPENGDAPDFLSDEEEEEETLPQVPDDFPVRPLGPDDAAQDRRTDGVCGLSWDDAVVTSWTPAPAGRCPFEHFHADEA